MGQTGGTGEDGPRKGREAAGAEPLAGRVAWGPRRRARRGRGPGTPCGQVSLSAGLPSRSRTPRPHAGSRGNGRRGRGGAVCCLGSPAPGPRPRATPRHRAEPQCGPCGAHAIVPDKSTLESGRPTPTGAATSRSRRGVAGFLQEEYVCACTCVCMCAQVHVCTCVWLPTCACIHTCDVCTAVCTCLNVCAHVCGVYTCVSLLVSCACLCVHMCECACVCALGVCMHVCACDKHGLKTHDVWTSRAGRRRPFSANAR